MITKFAVRHLFAAILLAFVAITPTRALAFTLEGFFEGKTFAYGKFAAINGTTRTFQVTLNGDWDGQVLRLREDFVYSDGERDRKTWVFTKTGEGRYTGTREDVKGTTRVRVLGNRATFSYLVDIDNGPEENIVRFFDTLVLNDDGTLRNTALVSKFGFPVARAEVNFARTDAKARAIAPR